MELTGDALDLAVARCEPDDTVRIYFDEETGEKLYHDEWDVPEFSPSTNWAQGGHIIEREKIVLVNPTFERHFCTEYPWLAWKNEVYGSGETPLIAAMRCYVASVTEEI